MKVCFNYTSEFEHKYRSFERPLVYFKYTSEFANKYIYLESLLPVYFWVFKKKYISLESIHQSYFWVKLWKSTSSILINQKANTYVNQEILLQVYFWIRKCINGKNFNILGVCTWLFFLLLFYMYFKKRIQSILEVYFITEFLMDSKYIYTWNILLHIVF